MKLPKFLPSYLRLIYAMTISTIPLMMATSIAHAAALKNGSISFSDFIELATLAVLLLLSLQLFALALFHMVILPWADAQREKIKAALVP